ncbi:hypothetical protein [Streptomyces sp. NPDC058463]|uniref:hypothetical protein n=1 Tax=Streptomyces sp. NPDC058463 TaxID=3346510 RepID=UPI0036691A66
MSADRAGKGRAFEDVVRARTEADFVERDWLYAEIERALDSERGQYVLVTGEPGAGKTSLLAGMARARPERLRYFFRRDSRTALTGGDTQSFLLTIGHQLARVRPELFDLESLSVVVKQHIDAVEAEGRVVGIRIEDLRVSPFQRTATLEVEQDIEDLAGEAVAVQIGTAHLEPRLLDPDNLAHLALIGPAQVLAAQDPEARIVILLDALDEIADDDTTEPRKGLLHWLARSPELPANVQVVMTSRPHSGLRLFRAAREERLTEVVVDAGSPQVVNDLRVYADRVLETDAVIAMEQARGHLPGSAKRHAVKRAAGNFLYLATYARALNDAVAGQDGELVDRLLVFSGVPGSLPGLYGFFVELAREELTPWLRHRAGEPAGWERVGLPVIGVLTVAREALTEEQLSALSGTPVQVGPARKVLESLRWLLDRSDGRIAFFHTSISEFLAGEEARAKHPECWVDETEWHEQIVRHYRGAAANWEEVDWTEVDRYGLVHLVTHLLRARPRRLEEAVDLVCPGLRRAVRTEFGAHGRFLELVDSVAHHVADSAPVGSGLPALMYLGVVRQQAAQSVNALPTRVIGLLARTGRRQEALEYVAGMTPSSQQFTAVTEILKYTNPGPGEPPYEELLDLLVESVLTIPRHGNDHYRGMDAKNAAETAALLLAPHDLERALRLWRHGREWSERASRPEEEPDAVYRAAAVAEQDVDRARVLIGRIRGDRWTDYLDLAERADPGRATELLWAAERSLDTLGPAVRVLALSRLASAWAPHDPDTGRRFLAEALAQVFDAGDDGQLAPELTGAATALRNIAPDAARLLLARLDTVVVNGITERALLDAAGLWTRWGSPERARVLVDRCLARTSSPWAELSARKALGQSDLAEDLRLIERVHADIPEPPADPTAYGWAARQREDDLGGVVRRMAEYDLARAAQMAGGIAGSSTRYELLADIAHRHLDRGEASQATALLEEVLRSVEHPAPIRGSGGAGTGFTTASPESSAPPARSQLEKANIHAVLGMFNLSHHWAARARGHFFREPVDVVRAVELGPSGNTARAIRGLAGRLAHRDLDRAGALVRAIADPGERAIGFAELHRAAHGPDSSDSHHGPEADAFAKEIDRALDELPRHRWTVAQGDDSEQHKAWAYARPDIRVRFELAVRALGCRKADMQGLQGLTFLAHVQRHAMLSWASKVFAADMIRRKRPHQVFTETHLENLAEKLDQSDETSLSRVAAAAYHEFRIAREVPGYTFHPPKVRIDAPIYAAAVDLVTPAPGAASLSPSFTRRLRGLLSTGPLPAAAGLVAFAAEARPENRDEIRALAAEVVAKARDGSATGVDALAVLVASPVLGDLVDPVGLLHEAERCTFGWPGEHWIPADVVVRLFPVLLERAPTVALRRFYGVVSADWAFAMELLERGADALIDALDTDLAATFGSAMARALACTSPDGTAPDVVDGVRLDRLVATGRAS